MQISKPAWLHHGGAPLLAVDVQPGVCAGLRTALLGMRVGGKRTVTVPPELGFGQVRPTAV